MKLVKGAKNGGHFLVGSRGKTYDMYVSAVAYVEMMDLNSETICR